MLFKEDARDFPGGPVVKNLPSNAGDAGLIPGQGTKIPQAVEQLILYTTRKTQHSQKEKKKKKTDNKKKILMKMP